MLLLLVIVIYSRIIQGTSCIWHAFFVCSNSASVSIAFCLEHRHVNVARFTVADRPRRCQTGNPSTDDNNPRLTSVTDTQVTHQQENTPTHLHLAEGVLHHEPRKRNKRSINHRERERNVLFNDTLNTFYLRLYGVRHMVKDHSDSEKGNPLPPHRLLFPISSKGYFICTIPQTG